MIDITTIQEVIQPVTGIQMTASKTGSKSTKVLWTIAIILITIFIIWMNVANEKKQNGAHN